MIKANELRIGNLLDNGYNIVHVTSISLDIDDEYAPVIGVCNRLENKNEVIIAEAAFGIEVKPIVLTPEWLERCGFIKINSNVPLLMRMPPFDRYRQFRWDYEGFKIETTGSGWIWPFDHVKYVHQIQNLFFALTNEELKIEL